MSTTMLLATASTPQAGDAADMRWQLGDLEVAADYPGANIRVHRIDADGGIVVDPDQRGNLQSWFHWSFRLRGPAGRQVEIRFASDAYVGVRGPALSSDGGASWSWQDGQAGERRRAFRVVLPDHPDGVRCAFGMPYQVADWQRFVAARQDVMPGTLCRSRSGREVPYLRCGSPEASVFVLVTARHHACEAMASWALQGFIAAIASDRALSQRMAVVAVPFADLDGVEDGDQGKGRAPHDHGRDYGVTSLYPETAAIRGAFHGWAAGRRTFVIDLHCPWIAGRYNQHIYQVGADDERLWEAQRRLGAVLAAERRGRLPYAVDKDLPYGTEWNTAPRGSAALGLRRWAGGQAGVVLSTAFEIPYADAEGTAVTTEGAVEFGADLARALNAYIMGSMSAP